MTSKMPYWSRDAWNAYENQGLFYQRQVEAARQRVGGRALAMLDYGSGRLGTGRMHLREIAKPHKDHLDLHDPFVAVNKPDKDFEYCVQVVGDDKVWGESNQPYDIVNLSYVLCFIPHDEALTILQRLRERNAGATFTIVDYILKGRAKHEVLELLNSSVERKFRSKEGDEAFYARRTKFNIETLLELTRCAGLQVLGKDIEHLDTSGIRVAIAARRKLALPQTSTTATNNILQVDLTPEEIVRATA